MLFRSLTSATFLALAASVAAQNIQYTKASAAQLGLLRRDAADPGYEPETAECSQGDSCAEACGDGYETCSSNDSANHCYNPKAGETCCEFPGAGTSCEAGYFCTHDADKITVCCAEGSSLDECAGVNKLSPGSLTSDPPVPESTSEAPTATKPHGHGGTGKPTPGVNGTDSTPTKGIPSPSHKVPNGGNAVVPASALIVAAGVFAALL